MKIREAQAADIPAISAIYGRSVEEEFASFEIKPPLDEEMLARFASLKEQGFPYLVAEEKNAVIGYCYVNAYRPRPAYEKTVENTIYVSPAASGRGVGRQLMEALIEACQKNAYRQMVGVIACLPDCDLDTVASIQLHKSLGFKKAGRLEGVGRKHGHWLDVILMQRGL